MLSSPLGPQDLNYCEFFAGQANVWRVISEKYPAARVDLDYSDPEYIGNNKMNPMNFLSCPGFAKLDGTNISNGMLRFKGQRFQTTFANA